MWAKRKVQKVVSIIMLSFIFGGCSIQIVDKRLTREEVAQAFKQRDDLLTGIATAIKQIHDKIGINKEEKKK